MTSSGILSVPAQLLAASYALGKGRLETIRVVINRLPRKQEKRWSCSNSI